MMARTRASTKVVSDCSCLIATLVGLIVSQIHALIVPPLVAVLAVVCSYSLVVCLVVVGGSEDTAE